MDRVPPDFFADAVTLPLRVTTMQARTFLDPIYGCPLCSNTYACAPPPPLPHL
jgi:hypothetical protein